VLRALGFVDAFDHWSARDGTLVLTGDVGHGRHLQEVFDFIHRLAAQAHRLGGRIVWTLGNHDLYVDKAGGQGGTDSLGYRLWPAIREAALHPERHPGLRVQAAYFEQGKLFVHGGVLPNIVALASREYGRHDAEAVAAYVNDVLRRTLIERERISARDLPHEIFHIGTSHTEARRMPGEIGYEPAGVFTPDLREVDHYRYHANLLPQVVGHTASRRGEIRYAPGSWLERDYIAIDVGRQHGTGNGGLLLTDFGWAAVTPGGPARLVEVTSLFAGLAREALIPARRGDHGGRHLSGTLSSYFQAAQPKRGTSAEVQEALFADLSPPQVVALEGLLATTRETGRCTVVTDLDEILTAFSRGAVGEDTVQVIVDYLAAGGVLVFSTDTPFDWLYVRLLRPLVVELGPRSPLLARAPLVLSGGTRIFAFQDGAYQMISRQRGRGRAGGFEALAELSETLSGMPRIEVQGTAYVADSTAPGRIDRTLASRVGIVVDVGDAVLDASGEPLTSLQRRYHRASDVLVAATAALRASDSTMRPAQQPEVGETVLWTFDRPEVPPGCRLRVRVSGTGFVHAGVSGANGVWAPVYNVPLVPVPEGDYEAVLPSGVNAFTFFWTEAPWTSGRPGHWERGRGGPRVFRADAKQRDTKPGARHPRVLSERG
jgi:hypothetical protein